MNKINKKVKPNNQLNIKQTKAEKPCRQEVRKISCPGGISALTGGMLKLDIGNIITDVIEKVNGLLEV